MSGLRPRWPASVRYIGKPDLWLQSGFDLTPKMRESALRGLPLFSQTAFGQRPGLFEQPDISLTSLSGKELSRSRERT